VCGGAPGSVQSCASKNALYIWEASSQFTTYFLPLGTTAGVVGYHRDHRVLCINIPRLYNCMASVPLVTFPFCLCKNAMVFAMGQLSNLSDRIWPDNAWNKDIEYYVQAHDSCMTQEHDPQTNKA